jgi:hypothetical protein
MPGEMDEIEEKLKQLKPEQLLKIIQELSKGATFKDETRQELREIVLLLIDEIKQNKEAADLLLKEKGGQMLQIINLLRQDKTLTDEQREELDRVAAGIAGYLMSDWLPEGLTRKIVMFLFLTVGIAGVVKSSLWFGLLVIFAATFSPRIVAEVLNIVATLSGKQRS